MKESWWSRVKRWWNRWAANPVPPVVVPPVVVPPVTYPPVVPSTHPTYVEYGEASYYNEGQQTANGETFDPRASTAAHKTLPFNTLVRVTNTASGKSVVVRINDRGPFTKGRIIDLSEAAFARIAPLSQGVVQVHIVKV